MVNLKERVYFVSSDKKQGDSALIKKLHDAGKSDQVFILIDIEEDLEFVNSYDYKLDFIICNELDVFRTTLLERFDCALNFIKLNEIKDYVLLLDK